MEASQSAVKKNLAMEAGFGASLFLIISSRSSWLARLKLTLRNILKIISPSWNRTKIRPSERANFKTPQPIETYFLYLFQFQFQYAQ